MDLFIGTDAEAGVEYLLTIWPDGTGELATRAMGSTASWSAPILVHRQPVEAVTP